MTGAVQVATTTEVCTHCLMGESDGGGLRGCRNSSLHAYAYACKEGNAAGMVRLAASTAACTHTHACKEGGGGQGWETTCQHAYTYACG